MRLIQSKSAIFESMSLFT